MDEVGLKDFISDTWNAITAPPKTPAPIVAKLNAAINDVLKMPEVQEQYRKLSLQPGGGTPQHLADIVKADTKRWGEVIREAKIPADLRLLTHLPSVRRSTRGRESSPLCGHAARVMRAGHAPAARSRE